ncbi:MAG: heavy-metal-associated domain-containing protein [Flavobacteriales bacterium]|jgi:copper chaperone CopZ|nr:heavy-metal-associated domain-containing protein [Flavobacteriales bacterium]MBT6174476.1 heavy-metal-associated domain-containing protein [Flavobacteriales bacterium]
MNKISTLLATAVVIAVFMITGCERNIEVYDLVVTEVNEVGELNKTTARLEIKGMMCEVGCVAKVKKELLEQKGVSNVTVNFDIDREIDFATIEYDPKIETVESLASVVTNIADGKLYGVTSALVTNYAPSTSN